jgi:hypothetical protein
MSMSRDNTVPITSFGSGTDTGLSASVLKSRRPLLQLTLILPPLLGQAIAEAITQVWQLPHMLDP